MIDVKLLLNDFDFVKNALSVKKVSNETLDLVFNLANTYKSKLKTLESNQAEQNAKSKLFFEYKKQNKDTNELQDELALLKSKITKLQDEVNDSETKLNEVLLGIPNLPDSKTPKGDDENDNVVLETILDKREFDFTPKEHHELLELNKWVDFSLGVKLAKSRFNVLQNGAAKLNRALINFMLDFNSKNGFKEICTPVIVNKDSLLTTGQLPKFENDMFKIDHFIEDEEEQKGYKPKGHELYLISTAEITLTNLYRDTIIPSEELPIMMCAYTPCFRKEAGSAGRDTRGIIRQHQFDKVELVAITAPDKSDEMQEKMLQSASGILKELHLPHRFVQLCRGKIRFKDSKKNILAHTLNGSSLAVGRTIVAIIENYQNSDGSISIPNALKKYMA